MKCVRFNYLYRDGANFKKWGEVVFSNPKEISPPNIEARLLRAFLPDSQFVASQIGIPEVFLFLASKMTTYDHCFHEFDSIEFCQETPTDVHNRSIDMFLADVEKIALKGWVAFDIAALL
jgi:hypothetical protein